MCVLTLLFFVRQTGKVKERETRKCIECSVPSFEIPFLLFASQYTYIFHSCTIPKQTKRREREYIRIYVYAYIYIYVEKRTSTNSRLA